MSYDHWSVDPPPYTERLNNALNDVGLSFDDLKGHLDWRDMFARYMGQVYAREGMFYLDRGDGWSEEEWDAIDSLGRDRVEEWKGGDYE